MIEEPVIGELYWAPDWFHALEISKDPHARCMIEPNSIIMMLYVEKHKSLVEIRFLCDSRACQMYLAKETFLERFNVLFKSIDSFPRTV